MKHRQCLKPTGYYHLAFSGLLRKKSFAACLGLFGFLLVGCLIIPVLTGFDVSATDVVHRSLPPFSAGHLLGTDILGRDVLSLLFYAGRVSLAAGICSMMVQVFLGVGIGMAAGLGGKVADAVLMRAVDIFLSIPYFPVAILLSAILADWKIPHGYRIFVTMAVIGFLSWPVLARVVRGEVLSLKQREFILSAKMLGMKKRHIMVSYLLPNLLPVILVNGSLGVASAILTESSLSFLGLGVTAPQASWGSMIQSAVSGGDFLNRPWLWIAPAVCIILAVLSIHLLSDRLREQLSV